MPPKSALLTAGTTNPWEKKPNPIHPMTTQDKIAKAEAKKSSIRKNVPREAPTSKTASKPKPRSLPPPDETAALARLTAERNVALGKKTYKPGKPMTTQQKIQTADAMKKAKDPYGVAVKEAKKAGKEGKCVKAKRAEKIKGPSMTKVLDAHESSTIRFEEKKVLAVISRRTKKAERIVDTKRKEILADPETKKLWIDKDVQTAIKNAKGVTAKIVALLETEKGKDLRSKFGALVDIGLLPAPGILELTAADLHDEKAKFRFMALPKELRLEIYRLVVVEHKTFIRPDSATGREQPDLAMVSRRVRSEVLPTFYAKNTFCIDLTSVLYSPKVGRIYQSDLGVAEKWADAVDSGKPSSSFSYIRNWVLDCAAPGFTASDANDDQDLMLSVRFNRTQGGSWSAVVEVHRDASCIMPGFIEHGSCNVNLTPDWVNEVVIGVCDAAKGGSVTSEMARGLARTLKPRMKEMVECRCRAVEVERKRHELRQ
ncbi:hypothetical protein LTR56_009331 [Elasticomyces elasticus]|nr:hypothetical protein LTR56_009331 [Elasticomyces elasticus]KAK3666355.1 hypothetical protein LTR22_002659 [Elasticomyces elasticus]KAK4917734.1 hypothetical protein LTR49_014411 [Elasticomyces elasticus]KAK5766295.1 hypothetical protein LTS12_003506 [Elasticomyces elasticus]